VPGSDGNFYGTTYAGGASGDGTVFRITPSGVYSSLYSFAGSPDDGANPYAGLVQGSDGNFYGVALNGGAFQNGTVFVMSPSGTLTNLYSFGCDYSDGASPYGGLVQGSDGNFYGTAGYGGTDYDGTLFKLTVPLNPPANQISSMLVDSSGTNLVFSIPSIAYESYQLQFSPSMNSPNWSDVGSSITSIGALMMVTNLGGASGSQGFYWFAITP
jgi:uncharacterized repeat protein (TIGR03803 family)